MPLIRVETNASLAEETRRQLAESLSRACARTLGKPESYVMVVIADGLETLFAGQPGPSAFVDVRSIGGLSGAVNGRLSEQVCRTLREAAQIPGDRVYLNFTDVPASHWGHDGATFG